MEQEIKINGKGRKAVNLSLRADLIEEYAKYCEKEGLIISRQIEKFIEQRLKEINNHQQGSLAQKTTSEGVAK
ncbi:MAG: hypothetical protein ABIH25_01105 [Candidatus Woesearchaeota archaeon]